MNQSPKTLRLYNTDPGGHQLSLNINRQIGVVAPRLRRGVTLVAARIVPGGFYDVCRELNVDLKDAHQVVQQSPEIKAHVAGGRILVREHPPSEANLQADAERQAKIDAAAKKIAEDNPPTGSIPVGVDQVAAGLRRPNEPPLPVDLGIPGIPSATPLKPPEENPSESAVDTIAGPDLDEDDEPVMVHVDAPKVADPNIEGEPPSTDWGIDRLKTYAAEKEIDIGNARSASSILKRIRRAEGRKS